MTILAKPIFPVKPIFAGKNYCCQSGFYHGKMVFSAVWPRPANPAAVVCRMYANG